MASKKNYDHYNMFVSPDSDNSNKGRNYDNYRMFSSSNQDNSLEARIFRRRRKRLNEEARENLIEGKTDWKIFSELPISESGYYRYKRIFMERLYELYISEGMVTREEILKESISE